jgi:hypothetical protein
MPNRLALPKPDRHAPRERMDYSKLALKKDIAQPDSKFRADVRSRGCQVRRRSPQLHPRCAPMVGSEYSPKRPVVDFCHTPAPGKKGMSKKASDLGNGIGMCHSLHLEQTETGWPAFAKKYDVDPVAIATELAADYVRRHPEK